MNIAIDTHSCCLDLTSFSSSHPSQPSSKFLSLFFPLLNANFFTSSDFHHAQFPTSKPVQNSWAVFSFHSETCPGFHSTEARSKLDIFQLSINPIMDDQRPKSGQPVTSKCVAKRLLGFLDKWFVCICISSEVEGKLLRISTKR